MADKNTGGLAFPQQLWGWSEDEKKMVCEGILPGMTLRDYFAGRALANLAGERLEPGDSFENTAQQCYSYADAMLKERNK